MESSNLQTSFIPKRSLTPGGGGNRPHRTTNVVSIVVFIIFLTVVGICIAAFSYNIYLNKEVDNAKISLDNQLTELNSNLITTLTRLDSRIESAKTLLNQHVALTGLFDYLSKVTLQNVQFTNFTYSQKAQAATIDLTGVAKTFAAVASQSEIMSQPRNVKYISNPAFNNFNLDTKGNVTFSVAGTISPSVFSYKAAILSKKAATASTTTATTTKTNQ